MKCYRLSTVRSIVNYVDNSRPVEKFGVAYYSWLEATVREHRFTGLGLASKLRVNSPAQESRFDKFFRT
jgi:hypothetical protein